MKIVLALLKWLGFGIYAVCAALIVMFLTPIGGWKALNVLTGSMRPTIQPGALVLIHRVPLASLKPGDIITYQNPRDFHQTITHRVVKIAKVDGVKTVTVKGDANPVADPPFPGGLVVGRVAVIVPAAGKYINYLHNPYGLAALVIIPGLFVIWAEVRRMRKVLTRPVEKPSAPKPEPEPAPMPTTVEPPKRSRNMDGMRRLIGLGMTITIVSFVVGTTYSAQVGRLTLTGNSFIVASATPAPNPSASPCPDPASISNTGHASNNTITCVNNSNTTTSNTTVVTVTNTNTQSAGSGNTTGGSSGSTSNGNTTGTSVTTSNF